MRTVTGIPRRLVRGRTTHGRTGIQDVGQRNRTELHLADDAKHFGGAARIATARKRTELDRYGVALILEVKRWQGIEYISQATAE